MHGSVGFCTYVSTTVCRCGPGMLCLVQQLTKGCMCVTLFRCCMQVRLATSDLKQPIRAAQGAAAQQAAALLKLSEQQALLQKQVDGSQELIAALQGLAAKQFKVCVAGLRCCQCTADTRACLAAAVKPVAARIQSACWSPVTV